MLNTDLLMKVKDKQKPPPGLQFGQLLVQLYRTNFEKLQRILQK